jgi:hypothetical protein
MDLKERYDAVVKEKEEIWPLLTQRAKEIGHLYSQVTGGIDTHVYWARVSDSHYFTVAFYCPNCGGDTQMVWGTYLLFKTDAEVIEELKKETVKPEPDGNIAINYMDTHNV